MIRRLSAGPAALLLALSGCVDNANVVGSQGVGGENPIHVGGSNSAGGTAGDASGGSGNAPGKGASGGSSGAGGSSGSTAATVIAVCRSNGEQITLAKNCETADDCVSIRDSNVVSFPSAAAGSCNSLVIGINQADAARFTEFSSRANCPPPVGCGLGQPMQQTEDGIVQPLGAAVGIGCVEKTCTSYAP